LDSAESVDRQSTIFLLLQQQQEEAAAAEEEQQTNNSATKSRRRESKSDANKTLEEEEEEEERKKKLAFQIYSNSNAKKTFLHKKTKILFSFFWFCFDDTPLSLNHLYY
jgi:hypothetical protein